MLIIVERMSDKQDKLGLLGSHFYFGGVWKIIEVSVWLIFLKICKTPKDIITATENIYDKF